MDGLVIQCDILRRTGYDAFKVDLLDRNVFLFTFNSAKQRHRSTSKSKVRNSKTATRAHCFHTIPAAVPRDLIWEKPLRRRLGTKTAGILPEAQRDTSESMVSEQTNQVEETSFGKSTRLKQGSPNTIKRALSFCWSSQGNKFLV